MNQNHASTGTYPCLDCGGDSVRFPTLEELEIHIASDHLNYCPYECERCRFAKFPTEYALILHCKNDHGLKEFFVRYRFTLEGERKSLELKLKRQRNGCEDNLSPGTSNGHNSIFHGSTEKYEDPDSFPSSVEPSGSSSDHVTGTAQPGSGSSASSGGVVPPSTSPTGVATTPTSVIPQVQRHISNSGGSLSHSLMNCAGPLDSNSQLHSHGHHLHMYGGSFPSSSGPSSALAELSPMDFASDAMSSGMDFAALIGEGEELIRKVSYVPKDAVTCQICGLKVSNQRSSLVYHANTKHIKLNLYQCAVCQKTWQTIAKSDVLKHVKAIHNGDESMIIDNRKRLGYQLRMFTARCFPPKPSNKARPLTAGCSPPRPGVSVSENDYSGMHPESASQILQSFIVSGGGGNTLNAPKEEPDLDHDEGENEETGDGLDEVDNSYGDRNVVQAALACMVAQQQQQQRQQQMLRHHEHS
ncbi:RING-type domain-containing protein [Trichostrongylus colubriformis]|uniref:RING-type domain-containing protein n=1 Tax=Trichostrongylus colubriformis TaxID=6319 RepID=A0AAN8FGB6_TRICO